MNVTTDPRARIAASDFNDYQAQYTGFSLAPADMARLLRQLRLEHVLYSDDRTRAREAFMDAAARLLTDGEYDRWPSHVDDLPHGREFAQRVAEGLERWEAGR